MESDPRVQLEKLVPVDRRRFLFPLAAKTPLDCIRVTNISGAVQHRLMEAPLSTSLSTDAEIALV
jgi:hypothetical protein